MTNDANGAGRDLCDADGNTGPCRLPAGWGTDHVGIGRCKLHGGSTRTHVAAARRRAAEVSIADYLAERNLPADQPPGLVLAEQLARWVGQVTYLHAIVAHLPPDGLKQADMSGRFEKPAVWVELLWRAESELRATAKVMDDARLGDRMVAVAERQGDRLAEAQRWILAELGLDPDEEAVRAVVAAGIRRLFGGQGELEAGGAA
jgi:hypothetical protein